MTRVGSGHRRSGKKETNLSDEDGSSEESLVGELGNGSSSVFLGGELDDSEATRSAESRESDRRGKEMKMGVPATLRHSVGSEKDLSESDLETSCRFG